MKSLKKMLYLTRPVELTFEAIFRNLAFELTQDDGHSKALKLFYEKIHPRYGMYAANMQAISSSRLSEVKLRMELFNGQGVLELYADKFSANFKNAVIKTDIGIMKDCIMLSLDALAGFMPQNPIKEHVFKLSTRIVLQGEDNNAGKFLDMLASGIDIDAKKLDATFVHSGFRREIGNEKKGWNFTLDFLRSNVADDEIFILLNAQYQEDGAYKSLSERAEHFGNMIDSVFSFAGLEAKQD